MYRNLYHLKFKFIIIFIGHLIIKLWGVQFDISPWALLMCVFKFETDENIFWHTEQVVLPLWIPRWFWRDFLFEKVLGQKSQENISFCIQSWFQLIDPGSESFIFMLLKYVIYTNCECTCAIWALRLDTVDNCLLQKVHKVFPVCLWTWL